MLNFSQYAGMGVQVPQTLVKSSANLAATAGSAALPAVAGAYTYLEGFILTGGGATAASVIDVTVTGLLGGTLHIEVPIAAGVTVPAFDGGVKGTLVYSFPSPLGSSAVNTAVTVNLPSLGSGNTNASVVAYGYSQVPGD